MTALTIVIAGVFLAIGIFSNFYSCGSFLELCERRYDDDFSRDRFIVCALAEFHLDRASYFKQKK